MIFHACIFHELHPTNIDILSKSWHNKQKFDLNCDTGWQTRFCGCATKSYIIWIIDNFLSEWKYTAMARHLSSAFDARLSRLTNYLTRRRTAERFFFSFPTLQFSSLLPPQFSKTTLTIQQQPHRYWVSDSWVWHNRHFDQITDLLFTSEFRLLSLPHKHQHSYIL